MWITSATILAACAFIQISAITVEDGKWGAWGNWTVCTRTCGTGVQSRTRDCFSLTGKILPAIEYQCSGAYKNTRVCNRQPCPEYELDLRSQQCRKQNNVLYEGRQYQWKPYKNGLQSCVLVCEAERYGFHAELSSHVIDGTPCGVKYGEDLDAICVEGICRKLGCDGDLDSDEKVDRCGKCGGDGTSCVPMEGEFTRKYMRQGYHKTVTIPSGAYGIRITVEDPTRNFLALRTHHGHENILNMGWQVKPPGQYKGLGTTFNYERKIVWRQQIETITATKPLRSALDVMILYQIPNKGVKYTYLLPVDGKDRQAPGRRVTEAPPTTTTTTTTTAIPPRTDVPDDGLGEVGAAKLKIKTKPAPGEEGSAQGEDDGQWLEKHTYRTKYQWRRRSANTCSVSCGGGFQEIGAMCVDVNRNIEVVDENCDPSERLETLRQECNKQQCPPRWVPGEWSPCSATCGPGTQTRALGCKRTIGGAQLSISVSNCDVFTKPEDSRRCEEAPCSRWTASAWSECSVTCGEGARTRNVRCVNSRGADVDDYSCPAHNRPSSTETCEVGDCGAGWFHSPWTNKCTESCSGRRERRVQCVGGRCNSADKPVPSKLCQRSNGCSSYWFTGDWEPCSATCGEGKQSRPVLCLSKYSNTYRVVEEEECDAAHKPEAERFCAGVECSGSAQWMMSAWSECEGTCSKALQHRVVQCLLPSGEKSDSCMEDAKPHSKRPCDRSDCYAKEAPGACQDSFSHCKTVVKMNLCRVTYYSNLCCNTCTKHKRKSYYRKYRY